MLILNSPSSVKPLKLPNIICTIGVFDGVHVGHKKTISEVIRHAREQKGTSTVITFDKHPYCITNPSYCLPMLTLLPKKLELLKELGLDLCILINFDKSTADITARDWIEEVLWHQLHINSIYIGKDSYFGKDRSGNIELLCEYGSRLGFDVHLVPTFRIEKIPVSSTSIRDYILKGDLVKTRELLGRDHSVSGTIVKGKGMGKEIGFPTLNLDTDNQCLPKSGVYAVYAIINNEKIEAVANIGVRPTFRKNETRPLLEIHLLDKAAMLSNQNIEVVFIKRLRDEKEFETASGLVQQIEKDIVIAKEALKGRDS